MLTRETPNTTLKAYIAQDEYECDIVFASSLTDAKSRTDMEVRRASEYDAYAKLGKVPPRVLIEDGWRFDCHGPKCSNKIGPYDDEGQDEDGDACEIKPIYVGAAVYCHPACNERANAEAVQHLVLARSLQAGLLKGWPGVTPGQCALLDKPPFIFFRFPGSQHDATWALGADHIKICALDSEAYAAYKATLPAAATIEREVAD